MLHRLKRLVARTLIVTLTLPASVLFALPSVAHGADSDVRINEVLVNGTETVELFNAGLDPVNISGWEIIDGSGSVFHAVPASTTLTAGSFYVATDNVDTVAELFTDTGDGILLVTASDVVFDSVFYGDSTVARVLAPGAAKTIGRVNDGTDNWYSGLTPGLGITNNGASVPTSPLGVTVAAGSSNATDVLNASSVGAPVVAVGLGAGSVVTDVVTARLYDATSFVAGTNAGSAGTGTVLVTTATASSLADGAIAPVAYVTNLLGVSTAFLFGTDALKDTAAPTPTVTTPTSAATVKGAAATISGATETGSTVSVYPDADNNGVRDSGTPVTTGTVDDERWTASVTLAANSANNFVITATDSAGNETVTAVDVPTITEDSTAPSAPASVLISTSAAGRAAISFATSASSDVSNYKLYTDNGTGTLNFTTALTSIGHPGNSFTTAVLANGTHQFVVRALDALGNESANTTASSVVINGPKTEQVVTAGATFNLVGSSGLSLTPTNATTLTVTNQGTTIPAGTTPTGITFLGQFFDVTSTNTAAFPVMVKYYYTQAQLTAANIAESQLQGIYYYDSTSTSWKLYGSTGVDTADQTVAGVAFAGFVWANADHFTPLAFGADTAAPPVPYKTVVTPGDGQAKLTWERVNEATSYWVRYRVATSSDSTVSYTRLFVSGQSNNAATITGLTNGTLYEFGVAAQDAVGNSSDFAVVNGRPAGAGQSTAINPATSSTTDTTAITAAISTTSVSVETSETAVTGRSSLGARLDSEQPATEDVKPADTSTQGEVKADQASESDTNRTRLFVTLLILLIAAGAGAAGYYGYQWWSERPAPVPTESVKPAEPSSTAPKPKKNGSKGGRW